MKQLRDLPLNAVKYMLIALGVYGALLVLGLTLLLSEGLNWQTWERFSTPQKLLAALVAAPGVGLVYLLAEVMAEALYAVLCLATFKIVTLGQVGLGIDSGAPFRATNTTLDTSLFRLVVLSYCLRLHASSQTQICDLLGGVNCS